MYWNQAKDPRLEMLAKDFEAQGLARAARAVSLAQQAREADLFQSLHALLLQRSPAVESRLLDAILTRYLALCFDVLFLLVRSITSRGELAHGSAGRTGR